MLLDIAVGVLMGVLTGMGIGGGGLLVMYLTAVRGMGQVAAQGCNLLFFVFASASSLYVHSRKRRLDHRMIGAAVVLASLGALLGTALAGALPEQVIRRIYGWMLIFAGASTALRLMRFERDTSGKG